MSRKIKTYFQTMMADDLIFSPCYLISVTLMNLWPNLLIAPYGLSKALHSVVSSAYLPFRPSF
ncbi:hypothetical protein GCWU000325_00895 [Alloprevotella tannerae ATCC 51259]|uniref:Uncharacterized protein n=1 Tax=Alloprevotella tannerae ATCC 51259 TaxID=626522 RepID=C9LFB3_9BACT|nr:hypothetical protein GCWU000325_00895 [Alloprevotella tannerae ATCC 51259]